MYSSKSPPLEKIILLCVDFLCRFVVEKYFNLKQEEPENTLTLFNIASLCYEAGDFAGAVKYYETLVAL